MALLVAVLVLALAAPAAAQTAVDRAARALQQDRVYVDPQAAGALPDPGALERRIGDRAVRVAVLPEDAAELTGGSVEALAGALAEKTGRPGTYAVVVGDRLVAGPSTEAVEAAEAATDEWRGQGTGPVLLGFVDRLEGGEADGDGGSGTVVLLAIAGAGGAAMLVALGQDIHALDLDMELPDAPPAARAAYEQALAAYERANTAWNLARRADDLEPVGAALEEGRWAMACARAHVLGHEPPERRSPCFFDPRHGPSARDVEWAPPFGEARMVPACEADAARVERGAEPHPREVTVDGRRMPYWAAGPGYAPFMGGFYGAALPGFVLGSSLGSAYEAPSGGDWGGGDFGGNFGGGDFGGGGGDFGGG